MGKLWQSREGKWGLLLLKSSPVKCSGNSQLRKNKYSWGHRVKVGEGVSSPSLELQLVAEQPCGRGPLERLCALEGAQRPGEGKELVSWVLKFFLGWEVVSLTPRGCLYMSALGWFLSCKTE